MDQYFYNMTDVENLFMIIIFVALAYWGYKQACNLRDQGRDTHLLAFTCIGLYLLYLFTHFDLSEVLYNPFSYFYFGFLFVGLRRLFQVLE